MQPIDMRIIAEKLNSDWVMIPAPNDTQQSQPQPANPPVQQNSTQVMGGGANDIQPAGEKEEQAAGEKVNQPAADVQKMDGNEPKEQDNKNSPKQSSKVWTHTSLSTHFALK